MYSNLDLRLDFQKMVNSIKYTNFYNSIDKKHEIIASIDGAVISSYPNLKEAKKLAPIKLKNILNGYVSTEKHKRFINIFQSM